MESNVLYWAAPFDKMHSGSPPAAPVAKRRLGADLATYLYDSDGGNRDDHLYPRREREPDPRPEADRTGYHGLRQGEPFELAPERCLCVHLSVLG